MEVKIKKIKFLWLLALLFIYHNLNSQIPEDGLIGYYMLEGNGADSSSYGHDGLIVDNVTPTADRFGNDGKACLFDGGYIDAGNPVSFQLTEEISISAWIKPIQINDWSGIVSKWSGFNIGAFYLGINPDNNSVRWNLDMPNPIEGNELMLNEWLHIVSTYDGDTVKIYENGVLINEDAYENGIQDVAANLLIGSQYDFPFNYLFNGAIDDVLIYNRALEVEEIGSIYNEQITSINEVSVSNKYKIYPNPSNGIFMIANNSSEEIWYAVFNSKGIKLIEGKYDEQINISNLSAGIYYLKFVMHNKFVTEKIILH